MKTFLFNPSESEVCPICGSADIKEAILIPIFGTEEGNNIQAVQVHVDCLATQLVYDKVLHLIYTFTIKE
jgi:hypothetical protein